SFSPPCGVVWFLKGPVAAVSLVALDRHRLTCCESVGGRWRRAHQRAPYLGLDLPPDSHSNAYPLFLCPFVSFDEIVSFPLPPPLPNLGGPDDVLSASPPPCCYQIHMASSQEKAVAVILMGGPTKGTRFRPLSLNVPKPLVPLAGQPMINHPISACKRIPNLARIYLIGFYEEREFALYVSSISNELRVPVRYLREDKPLGSAGGIYKFRDHIMEENPCHIFLLNCDVCCSFPLSEMLDAHRRHGGMGTMLVIKVSAETANQFGELVADPVTNEVLHYTERPETFVNDLINCGVYVFTPQIFTIIQDVAFAGNNTVNLRRETSLEAFQSVAKVLPPEFVRLDQDILTPLAGKKKLYTYETVDFWEQIKTPGMSLRCSGLYLSQFRAYRSTSLSNWRWHQKSKYYWIPAVFQGEGDYNAKLGITILGEAVAVEDEVVVINSIILPNKTLNISVQEEIIL
ncbi:Nucleotidyl transferase, partial [Musa troglodytarum]